MGNLSMMSKHVCLVVKQLDSGQHANEELTMLLVWLSFIAGML